MQPLAYRMRPTNLSEVVGQQHLVAPGKIIDRMCRAKLLSSMILYGPPGIGKTSIASAIAGTTKYSLRILNAATDGKKELEQVAAEAKISGTVILLLDEIHRLTKPKQDFLLPHLEAGRIVLIGATTENPFIAINPAIRSRCQIFELKPLEPSDIKRAINRALADEKNGLGKLKINLTKSACTQLCHATNGDLRSSLNALELAAKSTPEDETKTITIDETIIGECLSNHYLTADKNGDAHYDVMSAFQKSIRGSDCDAALYYLARLLAAGDLISATRRLQTIAYEDIGLANPPACAHTTAAIDAALRLGLPEARIPLANAVIELCLSPKSNSAIAAIDKAMADVKQSKFAAVPNHLKDAHYQGAAKLNRGTEYKYPHDYPADWVAQQYLPDKLINATYYHPKQNGRFETAFANQYHRLKQAQRDQLRRKN